MVYVALRLMVYVARRLMVYIARQSADGLAGDEPLFRGPYGAEIQELFQRDG